MSRWIKFRIETREPEKVKNLDTYFWEKLENYLDETITGTNKDGNPKEWVQFGNGPNAEKHVRETATKEEREEYGLRWVHEKSLKLYKDLLILGSADRYGIYPHELEFLKFIDMAITGLKVTPVEVGDGTEWTMTPCSLNDIDIFDYWNGEE